MSTRAKTAVLFTLALVALAILAVVNLQHVRERRSYSEAAQPAATYSAAHLALHESATQ